MKITAIKVAKLNEEELRGLVNAGERPTLKTIARISGLAVTTVSRAMRDESDIGADTKELVARIAEAIGYVPNRAGLRLRTGRTNVISLVVPAEGDVLNNVAKLTNSIAKRIAGHSVSLERITVVSRRRPSASNQIHRRDTIGRCSHF